MNNNIRQSTDQNTTQLLVSVQNPDEAKIVCGQEVDILDVKAPQNGPLGRVDSDCLAEILQWPYLPPMVSCALGELVDCCPDSTNEFLHSTDPNRRLNYVKIGLAHQHDNPNWQNTWLKLRARLPGLSELVPVAYADHENCGAPDVNQVLDFALASNCRVLLIGTFEKNGSNLFDHCSIPHLKSIRSATFNAGIKLCLAGSIKLVNLESTLSIGADFVGVRGAVCHKYVRDGHICKNSLQKFRQSLASSQKLGKENF